MIQRLNSTLKTEKPAMKILKITLALAMTLAVSVVSSHAQSATATISGTAAGGGMYDYTITLFNNGSEDLNGFWYGWTANDGFDLPSDPTSAGNSLGWDNDLYYNSIEWMNNSGTALAPGDSATFTLESSDTPAEITASPSGNSVAYTDVGWFGYPEGYADYSTDAFAPTLVAVPEPSSLALFTIGAIVTAGSIRFFSLRRSR
jgi:PEP-CTERM motif